MFLFSMLTQFIIQPLWPAFGEAIISGDFIWAKKTLKKAISISIISNSIIALPLLFFGKQIIRIWIGEDFIPDFSLLLGFYFFIIFANYGGVMSTFLNSGELLSKQLFMIISSSLLSVILKIYLTKIFGISGTIWSIVIAYSIFYVLPSYNLAFNYFRKKIIIQNNNL